MTPQELLKRTPERIEKFDDGVPIEVHFLKEFDFDYRRSWVLAVTYVKGEPVAILQNAGREGDDHCEHYVLDEKGYKRFRAELDLAEWSFYPYGKCYTDSTGRINPIELDTDLGPREQTTWNSAKGNKLTTYYGSSLDGRFDRYRY